MVKFINRIVSIQLLFSLLLVSCEGREGTLVEFDFRKHLESNYWCYKDQKTKCLKFYKHKLIISENGIDNSILLVNVSSINQKQLSVVTQNLTKTTFIYTMISRDSINIKQINSNIESILVRSQAFN